jgi:hypothetical protein
MQCEKFTVIAEIVLETHLAMQALCRGFAEPIHRIA